MKRKVYLIGLDGMMYPIYKRFAKEGVLPKLQRLEEKGILTEVYSSLPAYTPTNWTTMMTGAHSGTHSILRWFVDLPDPKHTKKSVNSFLGNVVKAETIFEAAAHAKLKSVAFHYPASSPRRTEDVYVIDGFSNPAYGSSPFELTLSLLYTNISDVPRSYQIELSAAKYWTNLPPSHRPHLEFPILIVTKQDGENRAFYGLVVDEKGSGYDKVLIYREKDGNALIASSRFGEWSQWCFEPFVISSSLREVTFRFKTVELTPDASRLRLYRSQGVIIDEFCEPRELGRELVDKFGPYLEHASVFPHFWGWTDIETCLEEMDYQSQWIARAGRYMMDSKNCSLFYCHIHIFDYVNHLHLPYVDPESPSYDRSKAEEHWEIYRQCYMQADRMIGTILEGLDEGSCLVIASDHAAIPDRRAINIRKFLHEKGLLVLKDISTDLEWDDTPDDNIDWEKTKVFMKQGRGFDIFINANENTARYLEIQQELIQVLRTWVDEETGRCPVSIALRKKDAPLLGFWGDQCGDVVFINDEGYVHGYMHEWGGIKGGGCVGEPFRPGAHHGPQLPTCSTRISSNMAFLLASGPGIKKGYKHPTQDLGYIHMTSIVPLICHLLDIEPPAQCQGALPRNILEAWPSVMDRRTDYPEWEPNTSPAGWGDRVQVQKDMFDV